MRTKLANIVLLGLAIGLPGLTRATSLPSPIPSPHVDACLKAAAQQYGLSYILLRAIAEQESRYDPVAIGRNPNGSLDIGLMQINSAWLPLLQAYGVTSNSLLDPCTNAFVGAWVLRINVERLGATWGAVGAYNANSAAKQLDYAKAVLARVQRLLRAPTAVELKGAQRQDATAHAVARADHD